MGRRITIKTDKLLIGIVLAGLVYACGKVFGLESAIVITLSITMLTASWWVTEAIPIPVTSLVPFVLFPVTGVLSHKQAASALGSHVILLLMGGFIIAKAIERNGLHKRIAISMLGLTGGRSGKPIVFAFMAASVLLSMWISNTATCLVLMPIALAVLKQIDDDQLTIPLVLAIAFSCNVGGIATLVGTPPNLIFAAIYEETTGQEFSFARWFSVGFPVVIIALPLMGLWLTRNLSSGKRVSLPSNGAWQSAEMRVLAVFLLIVALWVFRLEPFGGWSTWFAIPHVGDSTIALLGVVLMFCVPSGREKGKALLDWQTAQQVPWGMLLLFAGGIVIAKAFAASGTGEFMAQSLSAITTLHPLVLVFGVVLMMVFLTDITSNVATTSLFMPILAASAMSAGLPIETMMMPAAIAASCAFMLPVATAPNAIAYGTGKVPIPTMMKEGIVLNVILAIIIALVSYWRLF